MKVSDLDTPVLLLDLDRLQRNIARMRDMTKDAGVRYRPHTKTHKSPVIARMQMEAGASGICCAKLGEAEIMAAEGLNQILITTPVVGESKIGRLLHARQQARIAVVADNEANVAMLGRMAATAGVKLDVVVEIDVGQGRCGVQDPGEAVRLGRSIADHPWLDLAGLQGYQGRIQMTEDAGERRQENDAAHGRIDDARSAFESHGLPVSLVTGGGTGTSPFDLGEGSLTEIQPGSYVFMDSRYRGIAWPGRNDAPFEQAIHVLTTVISRPTPDRAVLDAGFKALSSDQGLPTADYPFRFGGDEHGILDLPAASGDPGIGTRLRLCPSHCDTTVNLYDQYIVVQGEEVVDVWQVATRGKSQ